MNNRYFPLISGESEIDAKFDALVHELHQISRQPQSAKDEQSFLTILKYLTFGASMTPVPELMSKKILKNITSAGTWHKASGTC